MKPIVQSISQIAKGALKAFETFPASIACAVGFAIVTLIRIHLDWPDQEAYNFLFSSLHWAFALGAIFSLATITAAKSRSNKPKDFLIANGLGILVTLVAFLMLYFWGRGGVIDVAARYARISEIANARMAVALLVSALGFIFLASHQKGESDFSRALFMTMKAFFIAMIYGAVIMGGTSGVAGAVEALLYNDMSEKVYMYLATISGFLAFTIFTGYFPDFRKGVVDEKREIAQNQPKFIEILFGYIMVPLMLALTVVLLLWAGRAVVTGEWPIFRELSGIVTGYVIFGLWLHVMITHHEAAMPSFYRKVYPIAALIIMTFAAWAVVNQLGLFGLKKMEYGFILTLMASVAASVLLLLWKAKAHPWIVAIICLLATVSVLPMVGYNGLPIAAQTARLETLLMEKNMLQAGKITPADETPDQTVREAITDAVDYLVYAEDAKLPEWLSRDLTSGDSFRIVMGFDKTWPEYDNQFGGQGDFLSTRVFLPPMAFDIEGYKWTINTQSFNGVEKEWISLDGKRGEYRFYWKTSNPSGIPTLKVTLNDAVLLETQFDAFIDHIAETYPNNQNKGTVGTFEDMSVVFETPELKVLVVFRSVELSVYPREDVLNYWLDVNAIYVIEK